METPVATKPVPPPVKPVKNYTYKWKRIFGHQWTPPIWYRRETIPATHELNGEPASVVIHKFWFLGMFHCVLTTIREIKHDQE